LSINRSDWLAHLATDRGVTCVARGGDVLFSRQQLGPSRHILQRKGKQARWLLRWKAGQHKAGATKTMLPPLVEKPSKLMKVSENLIRRKTEPAKVVATEKEKKKVHDVPPIVNLEKKTSSKRKAPSTSESDMGLSSKSDSPRLRSLRKRNRGQTRPRRQMKTQMLWPHRKSSCRVTIPQRS
jgi:hypothetical protein